MAIAHNRAVLYICYVGHHSEHNITNRRKQHRDYESRSTWSICDVSIQTIRRTISFHHPHTTSGHQPQVISGDVNSHSSQWGYATTNTAGGLVDDWADTTTLSLVHDPKLPSSSNSGRWRRGYNSDFTFVTNRIKCCCNKIVMDPLPRS